MKQDALQALQHVRTTLAYQLTPEAVSELLEPIQKALEADPQDFSATQMRDGYKLWLWRNGDHYLAFTHLYPCFTPGGDPMTLGEPTGVAIFRESHDRATKASTAGCIDCGLVYGECKCMFPNPSQPDKITAYREDGMFCVTYRSGSLDKAKIAHKLLKHNGAQLDDLERRITWVHESTLLIDKDGNGFLTAEAAMESAKAAVRALRL